MKQSDVFTIIIVATVGILATYFGVNSFLGNPDDAVVRFKAIGVVSPSLSEPDSELFNPDAINPTVEVHVGECEDIDGNGILDEEEQRKCGLINQDEKGENITLYTCADGSTVSNQLFCDENLPDISDDPTASIVYSCREGSMNFTVQNIAQCSGEITNVSVVYSCNDGTTVSEKSQCPENQVPVNDNPDQNNQNQNQNQNQLQPDTPEPTPAPEE